MNKSQRALNMLEQTLVFRVRSDFRYPERL